MASRPNTRATIMMIAMSMNTSPAMCMLLSCLWFGTAVPDVGYCTQQNCAERMRYPTGAVDDSRSNQPDINGGWPLG